MITRKNTHGGSAAGGGIDLQARVIAFVAVHVLAQRPLRWFEQQLLDVPSAVWAESAGPGDDLRIELVGQSITVEAQAKRGLKVGQEFNSTVDRLMAGMFADPNLWTTLVVDPSASRTVRVQIAKDLRRASQGRADGLHPPTQSILKRSGGTVCDAHAVARRLAIVTLDVEQESAGHRGVAREILRALLARPDDADAAWAVLVQDGHRLIAERGRRDAVGLASLLETNGHHLASKSPNTVAARYVEWVRSTTSTFAIPGLSVSLPIDDAWVQLETMSGEEGSTPANLSLAAALTAYREWDRLSRRENTHPANDVTELGYRAVLVGGPGAGKTTLCRRTAHQLALSGEKVLLVRLPRALIYMQRGVDDPFVSAATEGFVGPPEALRSVLAEPDCIIADGLDECDPHRGMIGNALVAWAASRPRTRVVVATRPIGYDPALFPGWPHYDIRPLAQDSVARHARNLFNAAATSRADEQAKAFQDSLGSNRVASLAARSPLLLGFLVQLFLAGERLAERRADLCRQIIELWLRRDDRPHRIGLSASVARRSLNLIGWLLMEARDRDDGYSEEALAERLEEHFLREGSDLPRAVDLAERCLHFWEDLGVLEHLRVGVRDAYVFVHPTLGEYTAARFVAGMEATRRRHWLAAARRDPRWHETIVLAAGVGPTGAIVDELLALDDPNDLAATDALLAAAALAEAPPDAIRIGRVMERVVDCLTSPFPRLAYEAAAATAGLASSAPTIVGERLRPLLPHDQFWTRLAALRLLLSAGDNEVDLHALEHLLDASRQTPGGGLWGSGEPEKAGYWGTWNEVIQLAAKCLARRRPGSQTADRLKRLAQSGELSAGANNDLIAVLASMGRADIVNELVAPMREAMLRFAEPAYAHAADLAIVDAVLRVVPAPAGVPGTQRRLAALGALLYALQAPEMPADDWYVMHHRDDPEAVDAVLRGAMAAARIDPRELADDAVWARRRMEADAKSSLHSLLPHVPVDADWRLGAAQAAPIGNVVRALGHPSRIVAYGAASLLAAGAGAPDAAALVALRLAAAEEQEMEVIAQIAGDLWGTDALGHVLTRLGGPTTPGCRWLVRSLPGMLGGHPDSRTLDILVEMLFRPEPLTATSAAEVLARFDAGSLVPITTRLLRALNHWTARGTVCQRCGKEVRETCPTCSIIPESPRSHLVGILAELGLLSIEELMTLTRDRGNGVAEAALKALPRALTDVPQLLPTVFSRLTDDTYGVRLLNVLLALPSDQLAHAQENLLELLQSPSFRLRSRVVSSLGRADWITRDISQRLIEVAIGDEHPAVRDSALSALRTLRGDTTDLIT